MTAGVGPGRVVVVGATNEDTIIRVESMPATGETIHSDGWSTQLGGKGANQAVAAGRLGAQVILVTALGDDDVGDRLRRRLEAEGLTVAASIIPGTPTGRALVVSARDGSNTIIVDPGANGALTVPAGALPAADVVVAQLEVPPAVVAHAFRSGPGIKVLNASPSRSASSELCELADVVIVNEVELADLADRLAEHACVVATRGPDGAVLMERGQTVATVPAPGVAVVDSTGAGDAFAGCLATMLARGHGMVESMRLACVAGAYACTRLGAQTGLPTAPELDRAAAQVAATGRISLP